MELTSPALSGIARGLQIVSQYRGPHLEFYVQVLNHLGPEKEYTLPDAYGKAHRTEKTRFQHIHIQLQIANIGGQRAERIRFRKSGAFSRGTHRDFGGLFDMELPQLPPGQSLQLALLDSHELSRNDPDAELRLEATYYAPAGVMNFFKTLWPRLRSRPHHHTIFRMTPKMLYGDLPPVTYS